MSIIKEIGKGIGSAIHTVQETGESLTPSAEQIRQTAKDSIKGGLNAIRGSGNIQTELKSLAETIVDLPLQASSAAWKASIRMLTLNPIGAVKALSEGLGNSCKDLGKIIASPVSTSVATVKTSTELGKKAIQTGKDIARMPINGTIKAKNVVKGGIGTVSNLFFGKSTSTSPAPKLNPKTPSPSSKPSPKVG